MSNHFPDAPSSYSLQSITYTASLSNTGEFPELSGFGAAGVNISFGNFYGESQADLLPFQLYPLVVPLNFTTPGDAGSFDQDTFEATFASVLDNLMQAAATATDNDLTTTQGWASVSRQWNWVDADTGEYLLTWTDTMTYPAE